MRITILFGGTNKERLVSVASAQALHQALPEADLWFWDVDDTVHDVRSEALLGRRDAEVREQLRAQRHEVRGHPVRIAGVERRQREVRAAGAARVHPHRDDATRERHVALLVLRPTREHHDRAAARGTGLAPVEGRRAGGERGGGERRGGGVPELGPARTVALHAAIIRARRQSRP